MVFTLSKANLKECPVCESVSRTAYFLKIMLKKRKNVKNPEYPLKTKVFRVRIVMYIYEYRGGFVMT